MNMAILCYLGYFFCYICAIVCYLLYLGNIFRYCDFLDYFWAKYLAVLRPDDLDLKVFPSIAIYPLLRLTIKNLRSLRSQHIVNPANAPQ